MTDFTIRRAQQEAAKLAHKEHYGKRLTMTLVREAGRRAAAGELPAKAAGVVRRSDESATRPEPVTA